jgi:hypothetical protein
MSFCILSRRPAYVWQAYQLTGITSPTSCPYDMHRGYSATTWRGPCPQDMVHMSLCVFAFDAMISQADSEQTSANLTILKNKLDEP